MIWNVFIEIKQNVKYDNLQAI